MKIFLVIGFIAAAWFVAWLLGRFIGRPEKSIADEVLPPDAPIEPVEAPLSRPVPTSQSRPQPPATLPPRRDPVRPTPSVVLPPWPVRRVTSTSPLPASDPPQPPPSVPPVPLTPAPAASGGGGDTGYNSGTGSGQGYDIWAEREVAREEQRGQVADMRDMLDGRDADRAAALQNATAAGPWDIVMNHDMYGVVIPEERDQHVTEEVHVTEDVRVEEPEGRDAHAEAEVAEHDGVDHDGPDDDDADD